MLWWFSASHLSLVGYECVCLRVCYLVVWGHDETTWGRGRRHHSHLLQGRALGVAVVRVTRMPRPVGVVVALLLLLVFLCMYTRPDTTVINHRHTVYPSISIYRPTFINHTQTIYIYIRTQPSSSIHRQSIYIWTDLHHPYTDILSIYGHNLHQPYTDHLYLYTDTTFINHTQTIYLKMATIFIKYTQTIYCICICIFAKPHKNSCTLRRKAHCSCRNVGNGGDLWSLFKACLYHL